MKHTFRALLLSALSVSFLTQAAVAEKPATTTQAVSNLSAEKAAAFLAKNPEVIIIDVRTPKEFAEGHIAKAKNIDVKSDTFKTELAKLDREKTYLLHCRSGARSTKSLPVWKELGFIKVYHLDLGFLGWTKAGLPVSTGK